MDCEREKISYYLGGSGTQYNIKAGFVERCSKGELESLLHCFPIKQNISRGYTNLYEFWIQGAMIWSILGNIELS